MNRDIAEGKWKQLKGNVRNQWAKLTDDDVALIAGQRERLAGVIQERYGKHKEEVEREIDDWLSKN
jgi:uncharacterized protein YjbJ (UPF0337 family)